MLGVSLPFRALVAGEGIGSDRFLDQLSASGVGSIELRTVRPREDPGSVLTAAERVIRHGMRVSVHTGPRSAESAVSDIFLPLAELLRDLRQEGTVLVLHPVRGEDLLPENRRMLDLLIQTARREYPGVRFALENNRRLPDGSEGDSVALVTRVIADTDPDLAGICFDFGHFAWASRVWEREEPDLPPEEFTGRVIHTHIHALAPGDGGYTTHFPLGSGILPLREYLGALPDSFRGVPDLELEPERWSGLMCPEEGILGSLRILREAGSERSGVRGAAPARR